MIPSLVVKGAIPRNGPCQIEGPPPRFSEAFPRGQISACNGDSVML